MAANGEMGPLAEASPEDRAFNNNVADGFYYQQMAMRESYDVPVPLSPDLLVRENEIPILSSEEPVIVVEDGKVSYANRDGIFEVTSTRPHDSIPTQMGRLIRESQFSYNGSFAHDSLAAVNNTLISPITATIVAAKLADDFVERITGYPLTAWAAPFAVGNELAMLGEVASLAKVGRAANMSAKVPFRIADDVPDANHGGNLLTGVPNNISVLNAHDVRVSQRTVSYNKVDRATGQPYTYDDLVESMQANGWKGDPVDVVRMPDGGLTSMDNTRITAAREAGRDIHATVREYDELLTRTTQEARNWQKYDTWGEAINARIQAQGSKFSNTNPYGANESPRVTGKK